MKQKMFTILDEVFIFLEKYPVLRDNDERLMANIWNKYLGDITVLKAKDILRMLSKGELPCYESISRCRRKLQEEFPKLRGNKWLARHGKTQKDVKKEIKDIQAAKKKIRKAQIKRTETRTLFPVGFEYKRSRND